jgi:hypothetical protein
MIEIGPNLAGLLHFVVGGVAFVCVVGVVFWGISRA